VGRVKKESKMNENIYTITIIVLTIVYATYKFIKNKRRKNLYEAKDEGIEETTRAIEEFKQRKLKEQFQVIKERSDILFIEFLDIFCEKMGVSHESVKAKLFNDCILSYIREKTDELMKNVVYINNIANRDNGNWIHYKEKKLGYIFTTIADYVNQIWREDVLGIKHEESISKCREDMYHVYLQHTGNMLEEIRNISITYKKEIDRYKKILEDIKLGKGKVKK
jgi:hypothetical protein